MGICLAEVEDLSCWVVSRHGEWLRGVHCGKDFQCCVYVLPVIWATDEVGCQLLRTFCTTCKIPLALNVTVETRESAVWNTHPSGKIAFLTLLGEVAITLKFLGITTVIDTIDLTFSHVIA